jgi:hypothetical protein
MTIYTLLEEYTGEDAVKRIIEFFDSMGYVKNSKGVYLNGEDSPAIDEFIDDACNYSNSAGEMLDLVGFAAVKGNLHLMEWIYQQKEKKGEYLWNGGEKNYEGISTLWLAVKAGHLDIADFLCKNVANIDEIFDDGGLALMKISIDTRNKDLVRWLFDNGVSENEFVLELHHAAKHGDIEKIKFLSESGIDLDKRLYYEDGCTAIGENKNCKVKDYFWTALHLAIRSGKIETVETLLERDAKFVNKEPLPTIDVEARREKYAKKMQQKWSFDRGLADLEIAPYNRTHLTVTDFRSEQDEADIDALVFARSVRAARDKPMCDPDGSFNFVRSWYFGRGASDDKLPTAEALDSIISLLEARLKLEQESPATPTANVEEIQQEVVRNRSISLTSS